MQLTAQFCQFEVRTFLIAQHHNQTTTTGEAREPPNMSEKKRKRHGENGERPKKKVAIAPERPIHVELVENKEPLGPILGQSHELAFSIQSLILWQL